MNFDVLIDTMNSHLSLLPKLVETIPFGRGEQASQASEECWLYLPEILL